MRESVFIYIYFLFMIMHVLRVHAPLSALARHLDVTLEYRSERRFPSYFFTCWQILVPPQSLHVLLRQLCWQMSAPPLFLHPLLGRSCLQMLVPRTPCTLHPPA